MDVESLRLTLETLVEQIINQAIAVDPETVKTSVKELRQGYPSLTKRQLAEKIINNQSMKNGLLGAGTGAMGLVTLPITIPTDIAKAWRIQAFVIRCVAYIYGYDEHNTDLKTDIFLVLSSDSFDELKKLVTQEIGNCAAAQLELLKKTVIKETAEALPKYAAKAAVKYGGRGVAGYALKGIPKHLAKMLWSVGGRKVVEKAIQKSLAKAVPVIGAVTGFAFDWVATQAIGKVAIEFYEKDGPKWLNEQFSCN